jgi:hypothetical protein
MKSMRISGDCFNYAYQTILIVIANVSLRYLLTVSVCSARSAMPHWNVKHVFEVIDEGASSGISGDRFH